MKNFLFISSLLLSLFGTGQKNSNQQYKEDFNYFWTTIRDNYCYWDKKQTDWQMVKATLEPVVDTVTTRASFIAVLEKAFYEIYDHHASLNTNTAVSERLVPSGTDLWAEFINGKPMITEVRFGSGADKAGIQGGMELAACNDVSIEKALQPFLPNCLSMPDTEARNYALRLLLAGDHSTERKITLKIGGRLKDFYPDKPVNYLELKQKKPEIEFRVLKGNIGYILINNSLGDDDLIPLFDSALTALNNTPALILDMRNTPSGGNTTVARAIMGRFITHEGFYQKHELTSEEKESGIKRSWVEIVSPRKATYTKPLVILVDHWTGSVGEGIVIGFDALRPTMIVGTRMAGLNGAVYSFTMPNTGIGFSFPAEKLFHINGLPRENFHPDKEIDLSKNNTGKDVILEEGLKYISALPSQK